MKVVVVDVPVGLTYHKDHKDIQVAVSVLCRASKNIPEIITFNKTFVEIMYIALNLVYQLLLSNQDPTLVLFSIKMFNLNMKKVKYHQPSYTSDMKNVVTPCPWFFKRWS
ncbi:hypothetical protein CU097_013841 [Rhizopus azygosporus]|uniref:Uncharacterized protein n=1 Tax=Rhizopus azygosporus TaxID=86630 RepID=A0A367JYT2_RHIAZ|nr:hypothetical protein CU097_013841 [Rhizopus azygosporus]